MAAILKMWRQIENPTPSFDAYLIEEQPCFTLPHFIPIPDPIWSDGSLSFLESVAQQQQKQEQDE